MDDAHRYLGLGRASRIKARLPLPRENHFALSFVACDLIELNLNLGFGFGFGFRFEFEFSSHMVVELAEGLSRTKRVHLTYHLTYM